MGADGRRDGRHRDRTHRARRVKDGATPGERLRALESVCAAIAHPARRQILLAVAVCGGSANAGYIAKRFSCSWPTVSRHLKVLESAGLLVPRRDGRERIYRLNREALSVLDDWLAWLREEPIATTAARPKA